MHRSVRDILPSLAVSAMFCLLLASCGTGIEVTEHVTDKDVQRVMDQIGTRQPVVTLEAYIDSLPAWKNSLMKSKAKSRF